MSDLALIRLARIAAHKFANGRTAEDVNAGADDAARTSYFEVVAEQGANESDLAIWRVAFGFQLIVLGI